MIDTYGVAVAVTVTHTMIRPDTIKFPLIGSDTGTADYFGSDIGVGRADMGIKTCVERQRKGI